MKALPLFYKAIELDPNFAAAYGMASRCYGQRKSYGLVTDRAFEIAETARLARRAGELGKDDAVALYCAGISLLWVVGDLDGGAALAERALSLNPNLAGALWVSGWAEVFLGELDVTIERETRAMRLSRHDPLTSRMHIAIALAHFFAGRYVEALSWADMAIQAQPDYLPSIAVGAAAGALGGNQAAADKAMARLRQHMPEIRISNLRDLFPIRRTEDFDRWVEGMRKAGLPE